MTATGIVWSVVMKYLRRIKTEKVNDFVARMTYLGADITADHIYLPTGWMISLLPDYMLEALKEEQRKKGIRT